MMDGQTTSQESAMRQAFLFCLCAAAAAQAVAQPQVSVTNVRRIFYNGEHNAFTDLVKFNDQYYLTFRSCPDGHMVHPTASVIILVSDDLKSWEQVHRFRVQKRDTRDPHFLVFRNRLFVYTGTWYSGETTLPPAKWDMNQHLGFAAWSDDGKNWTSPVMLEGTFGHYIWRAATYNGTAYLCGRRKTGFEMKARGEGTAVQSIMLESDDGLIWRKRAVFQEERGDETAFQFLADGSILGIGRRARSNAEILRSSPPWTDWKRTDLPFRIGGPLLVKWNDYWVVGGRKYAAEGARTAMYWLVGDELRQFAELPSGGDTSYPGFLQLSSRQAFMTWYSSHEKDERGQSITAIYGANLEITSSSEDQ